MIDYLRLVDSLHQVRDDLFVQRNENGYWEGCLASSSLSTATAVSALSVIRQNESQHFNHHDEQLIRNGMEWLRCQQNVDGGWGDTDRSFSNISTTMLVLAAFELSGCEPGDADLGLARAYVEKQGGIVGLRKRYGKDKTFAVPILANCALAGLVSWKEVSALPFELACLPQSLYRFLQLPVVSYAIPALVGIGQAVYYHRPGWNPLSRFIRRLAVEPSLQVLKKMQPQSGGYLEAIPLTSFVAMSLAAIGRSDHPVVQSAQCFLRDTVRRDGSWPIDTNLSTWNTTLALNAIGSDFLGGHETKDCLSWLLACQNTQVHPFTGADPGGWGWTDLTGAVPDADDTPGALLALRKFCDSDAINNTQRARIINSVSSGIEWLLDLQNRDGGWPTFCRGWGKLPFDRSGADLTAHAIRALLAWQPQFESERIRKAIDDGFKFLRKTQRGDGAWIPLWFGNQAEENDENPVYGTSKVLLAFRDAKILESEAAQKARMWLMENQNMDGGWGGEPTAVYESDSTIHSSVEETALALEALLSFFDGKVDKPTSTGVEWLISRVEQNEHQNPSPIGFYFAKLWYYEDLYPLIFTVSALETACATLMSASDQRVTIQAT